MLQWMIPILLVMLIYLSTWTLSATPTAEDITDVKGLKFKQCTYNWWDHSLAIGNYICCLFSSICIYKIVCPERLTDKRIHAQPKLKVEEN